MPQGSSCASLTSFLWLLVTVTLALATEKIDLGDEHQPLGAGCGGVGLQRNWQILSGEE